MRYRVRLDQLNPVAERIVDVAPVATGQRLVFSDPVSGMLELDHHVGETIDDERRMRLAGGNEILVDAEMDRHCAVREPATAAPGKLGGLAISAKPSMP